MNGETFRHRDQSQHSESHHRPTLAVVNLDRIVENFRILRKTVTKGAFFCPMVKANAYGHGDVIISAKLRGEGAEHLGVGLIEEGLHLRESGDTGRILHFGMFDTNGAEAMIESGLTPVVSSRDALECIVKALSKIGDAVVKPIEIHLKINTGMNRLGIPMSEVSAIAARLADLRIRGLIKLAGLCTHFAVGEDLANPLGHSTEQLRRLRISENEVRAAGLSGFQVHIANSSAAAAIRKLRSMDSSYENIGIRPGLALYGVESNAVESEPMQEASLGIRPAMRFQSRLILIQNVPKGGGVSYGLQWRAPRDSKIGVVPCGYADGYRRGFSSQYGTTFVIVRGQRVPVVGTVCMDYFMCDLTEVESANIGDLVTLIGSSGAVSVTVNELAMQIQTIPYEIFTGISERVPRLYVDDEASDRYS